nr:MAG TPA: hypothetical protein [Bacteriophage sp.]
MFLILFSSPFCERFRIYFQLNVFINKIKTLL